MKRSSENTIYDGSSNGSYNSNREIKEIINFDSVLEDSKFLNSKQRASSNNPPNNRTILKPLSEQISPFGSRKISINDHMKGRYFSK